MFDLDRTIARLLAANLDRRASGVPDAEIIAEALKADVVFGAWPEPDRPMGIAFWPVKGEPLLDSHDGLTAVTVSAVPCASKEEALAMRERLLYRSNGGGK